MNCNRYAQRSHGWNVPIHLLTHICLRNLVFATAAVVLIPSGQSFASTAPVPITLGQSVVRLNGPWKFHIGDDASWADPGFDDSAWESLDLTPQPDAHDGDVGLTGYVPGWGARGHADYSGFAWYRMCVVVTPAGASLSLAGPPAVDSSYQVFLNGRLLGSAGRFFGNAPTVFSIQPRVFEIPHQELMGRQPGTVIVAFRVWMGPWDLGDPAAGGIHIAPALGDSSSIDMLYQTQWLQTIRGYVLEVVEAALFIALAIMACSLNFFERAKSSNRWLASALVLVALYRANQAVFFWGQVESVHGFEWIGIVFLIPLCLAAWTIAWHGWLHLRKLDWIPRTVGILTLLFMGAQSCNCSWSWRLARLVRNNLSMDYNFGKRLRRAVLTHIGEACDCGRSCPHICKWTRPVRRVGSLCC